MTRTAHLQRTKTNDQNFSLGNHASTSEVPETVHRCAAFTTSLNLIKASYAAVASEGLTMLNKLLGTWGPVILLKALKTSMTWLLGTDAITLPSAAFTFS